MNKILVLSFLLLLAFASAIEATSNSRGNLTILADYTANLGSVNVSQSISGNFSMNNVGTSDISNVQFTTSNFVSPKFNITTVSFNDSTVTVKPSAPYKVQFTVTAPSNAYAGLYTGTIYANNSAGSSDYFPTQLTVNPSAHLTATNPSLSAVQSQGQSQTGSYTITNDGNTDLTVAVSLVSDLRNSAGTDSIPKAWFNYDGSVSVPYAQSKSFNFTLNTNLRANQTTGSYTGTFNLTYGSVIESKTLTVNVVQAQKSVSIPGEISASWIAGLTTQSEAKFKVKNNGNVPLTNVRFTKSNLTFSSSQISEGLITVTPASIASLAVNAEQEIVVRASGLPSDLAKGLYSGSVTVDYGGAANASLTNKLDVRDPRYSISIPSSIALGGSSQDRNTTVTTSITVSNDGDYDLNDLNITFAGDSNTDISLDNSNFAKSLITTLSVSQNRTVYIRKFIPMTQDTGKIDLGDLIFKATNMQDKTISDFSLTTKSYLKISGADIDYETDDTTLSDGKVVEEVRPGSKVTLEIDVENLFDNDNDATEDMDIENIEVTVESAEDLADDSIDESSSSFDLSPEKEKTGITLEFDVPSDTETGKYKFTLTVEGTDVEDAKHKVEWTFYLSVEREDHDVQITEAEFGASSISCTRETYLDVTIQDIGEDDEDHARVKVIGSMLGIEKDVRDISLSSDLDDDDNEYSLNVPITVKSDAKAGAYKIQVYAYYDDDTESDKEELTLTVEDCGLSSNSGSSGSSGSSSSGSTSGTGKSDIVIKTPSTSPVTGTTSSTSTASAVPVTSSYKFRESSWYTGLLIVAVLIVLAGIVTLLAVGFRKPKYYN